MTSFLYRKDAVVEAGKQNYVGFRTVLDKETEMWKCQYTAKEPSPATNWANTHDYVHHAETEYRNGTPVGIIVVNITQAELQELMSVRIYEYGGELIMETPEGHFVVEPITPSLWEPDPLPGQSTKASTGVPGVRAKSDVESPVKLVHRLCDEMVGKPRAEVIAACIAAGVNKSTANTQYYHWNKKRE